MIPLCPALRYEMDDRVDVQGRSFQVCVKSPPSPQHQRLWREPLWNSVPTGQHTDSLTAQNRESGMALHPAQPGSSPGAESVAAQRWPIAARRLPHDTNYVRKNKCLQSLKQVPWSGAETALHRAALILGCHCPCWTPVFSP